MSQYLFTDEEGKTIEILTGAALADLYRAQLEEKEERPIISWAQMGNKLVAPASPNLSESV